MAKIRVTVDHSAHTVSVDLPTGSEILKLTPMEFKIVACMARHPGRTYRRDDLIGYFCSERETLHRTIDSHMCNLRSKLDAAGARRLLVTVREVGYKLDIETGEYFVLPRG
ncbi:winged helix-turn-helix transcriptional regulator [Rhizobium lentis]|uniref:winged helix-turn-helix domain-containing protein n=1 Tax=Rhizobium lentis TaxID=1138194 RepID=UPI001C82DEFA|nr:winged helix-turn-helix transcriptional regulator [Rhizobium lentis]